MRRVGVMVLAGALALAGCNAASTKPAAADREAAAVTRVPPVWPRDSLITGVSGRVQLKATVTAEGRVVEVQVVASDPPGLFDQAAIEAFSQWRFDPKREAGVPVASKVEQTISFVLEDSLVRPSQATDDRIPIVRVDPKYPADALAERLEGWVKLAGTVLPDGSVTDVRVVDHDPSGRFDAAALAAVSQWRFRPKLVDGVAVSRPFTQKLLFKPQQLPPDAKR